MGKTSLCQAAKDNDFSASEVYAYLDTILQKNYPDYADSLDNRNWGQIYTHYIKEESGLAYKPQYMLTGLEGQRKNHTYLYDMFFTKISTMGIDPDTMRIDMCIDLLGWKITLEYDRPHLPSFNPYD